MKKMKMILILATFLVASLSCKAQSQLDRLNNYTTNIVGTWVSEDDSSHKIEFTLNNMCKIYIDNNLEDNFEYSLDTICGSNSNNEYDVFLKIQTDIIDYQCDIINNISTDSSGITTLSITTQSGQLEIYEKQ